MGYCVAKGLFRLSYLKPDTKPIRKHISKVKTLNLTKLNHRVARQTLGLQTFIYL